MPALILLQAAACSCVGGNGNSGSAGLLLLSLARYWFRPFLCFRRNIYEKVMAQHRPLVKISISFCTHQCATTR